MKKLLVLVCMLTVGLTQAQEVKKPLYEKDGELVRATYFYDNGNIKQQGYFKDKKLTGTWTTYSEKGSKTAIANYKNGKKHGKWFITSSDGLKEIIYKNNKIISSNSSNVALK